MTPINGARKGVYFMNRITCGKIFKAENYRQGTTEKGKDWELLSVVDENGKNEISIFPVNVPCGVLKGQEFLLESIESISCGHRKGGDDKWFQTVSVNAIVSLAEAGR